MESLFYLGASPPLVNSSNPHGKLGLVLCCSLTLYAMVVFIFVSSFTAMLAYFSVVALVLLLLIFLLPSSYIYWSNHIDVHVIGPEPAVAEPGEKLTITVVTGLPRNAPLKGVLLEVFLGSQTIAVEKLETSPFELILDVPKLRPGYHKVTARARKLGYFDGTSDYELLIAQGEAAELS